MAADTAAKRLSAINLGNPCVRGFGVYPVGTSTSGARAAGLYLYSGIGDGAASGVLVSDLAGSLVVDLVEDLAG